MEGTTYRILQVKDSSTSLPSSSMEIFKNDVEMSKLCAENSHAWKLRKQMVLSLKELDEYVEDDPPVIDFENYLNWCHGKSKNKAIIGLTLSKTTSCGFMTPERVTKRHRRIYA